MPLALLSRIYHPVNLLLKTLNGSGMESTINKLSMKSFILNRDIIYVEELNAQIVSVHLTRMIYDLTVV